MPPLFQAQVTSEFDQRPKQPFSIFGIAIDRVKFSFFPRTITELNKLDEATVTENTVEASKAKIAEIKTANFKKKNLRPQLKPISGV